MPVISCDSVGLSYGADEILKSVSFSLEEGDKLGIIGLNGAGKTSLLSIIGGITEPTSGSVSVASNRTVGYLRQNAVVDSERTVLEEAYNVFAELIDEEKRLEKLRIEVEKDETLAGRFSTLEEHFSSSGGYSFRGRAVGTLRHLGFDDEGMGFRVSALSGGQKTRLALSLLLMRDPDILMLDEPTNHLDIGAMFWLEEELKKSRKTLIVVSHDRYFLDSVVGKIYEIEYGNGKMYRGNYTDYLASKTVDREIQLRHYENQQKEIRRQEAYIEQQRRWNRERNIIAAESRQKLLDKMVIEVKPENLPKSIRMFFPLSGESGNDVLSVTRLSKAYGNNILFKDATFLVKKHDRVFLTGKNGCGKSTILKIIAGKLQADGGYAVRGANVTVGYYDQENRNLLNGETVIDELWNTYPRMTETEVRSALALFNFRGETVFKPISVLSGGEKARLTLCKLMLRPTNLLILDEPTNHLDIDSREVLENALFQYDGTLIAVSHDRYFLKKLATRIFCFDGYEIRETDGDFATLAALSQPERDDSSQPSEEKQHWMDSKKLRSDQRKREHKIEVAKKEIEKLENRISALKDEMNGDAAFDHVRLSEIAEEIERSEDELLSLYETVDGLDAF